MHLIAKTHPNALPLFIDIKLCMYLFTINQRIPKKHIFYTIKLFRTFDKLRGLKVLRTTI